MVHFLIAKNEESVEKLGEQDNERPLPFANATPGRFALSVDSYGKKIDDWFA